MTVKQALAKRRTRVQRPGGGKRQGARAGSTRSSFHRVLKEVTESLQHTYANGPAAQLGHTGLPISSPPLVPIYVCTDGGKSGSHFSCSHCLSRSARGTAATSVPSAMQAGL